MRIWPTLPEELRRPLEFPDSQTTHAQDQVRLIETHLSYLFLTEHFVYKLKKRLKFDFVDFSTLELREHYCREELRLNAAFAPELYLAVVPLVKQSDGTLRIEPQNSSAEPVEWAVKMHRFDQSAEADRLVEAGELSPQLFYSFGRDLADQHRALPAATEGSNVGESIRENFTTIASSGIGEHLPPEQAQALLRLGRLAEQEVDARVAELELRKSAGAIKECHGDLHLSNMILADDRLRAFDCLEFNRELRTIDVWNDAAFLFMDCCIREREDLAYAFIDGYLEVSADFAGLLLLPMYANYRSMVRAKVAALAHGQHPPEEQEADLTRFTTHLGWAQSQLERGTGRLLVTCGLSGSGKSYWAKQLVSELGAVRLRSDVLRKAMSGLNASARTNSAVGEALYSADQSANVYQELARIARSLLAAGECVIVDATCLRREQRDAFAEMAAATGAESVTLHMSAPEDILRDRISARDREGIDPSEATSAVLDWQLEHQDPLQADEAVIKVDTCTTDLPRLVARIQTYFSSSSAH